MKHIIKHLSELLGVEVQFANDCMAEEATFLGIPCITLNTYAEHPETVSIGTNCLVGEDAGALSAALDRLNKGEWQKGHLPERWDGRAAERIVQTLLEEKL